jgi:hypothetical protein
MAAVGDRPAEAARNGGEHGGGTAGGQCPGDASNVAGDGGFRYGGRAKSVT